MSHKDHTQNSRFCALAFEMSFAFVPFDVPAFVPFMLAKPLQKGFGDGRRNASTCREIHNNR